MGSEQNRPAPEIEVDDNLGFLIHEAAHAISLGYSAVMAPLGLTRPQVRVLVWVDHSPGITQAELCERIGTSPMALTGLLDRMEGKNLVKRVDDPSDRRVKRLYLTSGALQLKPDMETIAEAFRQALRSGLTAEQIATTVKVLGTMKANAQRIREEAQSD
jgi:DNA-binding MarR family transcriptional regulator